MSGRNSKKFSPTLLVRLHEDVICCKTPNAHLLILVCCHWHFQCEMMQGVWAVNVQQNQHHGQSRGKKRVYKAWTFTKYLSPTCGIFYSFFSPRSVNLTRVIITSPSSLRLPESLCPLLSPYSKNIVISFRISPAMTLWLLLFLLEYSISANSFFLPLKLDHVRLCDFLKTVKE